MTPLEKDEGDAPSDIVYMYAGNSQYVWSEGCRVVSYDDSIIESREYLYQNIDSIEHIIYAVVHRLYKMDPLPYAHFEFTLWNKKQKNIDMIINIFGASAIKSGILKHFNVNSFNELTRLLNAISEEEFTWYGS